MNIYHLKEIETPYLIIILEGQLKNHAKHCVTRDILDSKMYYIVDIKELNKGNTWARRALNT